MDKSLEARVFSASDMVNASGQALGSVMRTIPHRWLRGSILLAGIAMSGWAAVGAQAMLTRNDALTCSDQNRTRVDDRITACTNMIGSRRLKGRTLGVAYALRGLAYLDRGDTPHAIGDLNRAIALAPDFVPAYQNRGNAWYARGNYGEALDDYDTAIRLDPKAASAYVNRATVRRDLGVIDGALADYQQAIELGARAPAYSGRGQLYMRRQDYAHAIEDFDRAVKLKPSIGNFMLRAKALEADGKLDNALADYTRAAQLASRNPPKSVPQYVPASAPENASNSEIVSEKTRQPVNTKLIDAMTAQAGIWRKKHDFDKAIAIYNRAVLADQTKAGTYALRAEAYMAMGDDKRAMDDIGRALKFSWRAGFLKTRGTLRLEAGDLAGTIHDADAILKLKADDNAAYVLRGAALTRQKKYAQALPDLDRAIKTDGKNALAYSARGEVYFAKHDNDRALADFNRAVELGAKNADLYRARAAIYKGKGNTDAAIADLTEAIRHGAEPADFFQRAALYKAKGDTDKVLSNLDAGLQREPDNLDALRMRASVERDSGDMTGAIADYSAVLKRDPKDTATLRARAEARFAGKDMAGAIADFDTLVQLSPRDLKTRYQRGALLEQNGDFAKAIDDYKFVLEHDRRFKDARAALKRTVLAQRKARAGSGGSRARESGAGSRRSRARESGARSGRATRSGRAQRPTKRPRR